ncbi:hypothetical protein GCM10018785_11190 [Streptomyces longispororuber]|uniref:Uncharacterized protein n=1 Tax=Streptomyces longispororuber TaxID=68230 RepID=A0A919DGY1_9ACTN|nr:hypothetical protein [Streptomyces longispororuber]GHE43417.1 hypothetical protein GCM10018785_11190 [Streptomyces longispororuber]
MAKGGGQDEASVSDEEWERFLRESVTGAADAPVEPSARARAVQRRLRESPGQPEGWRTYTPAPRRRRTGWYAAGSVAAVALLAVALFPQEVVGWFGGGDGDGGRAGGTVAAETERPREAPAAEPALRPTLAEPFRGSPAARWADGAAGITVPKAKATGWMDAAQVERALRRSKQFMVASGLDTRVLRGERPARAIALLNPHQKDVQRYLRAALSSKAPTAENDPLLLFSRFRPERARPAGDVVRTRGRLTYREGKRGAVEVTADVTFVYPLTPAAGDGGRDAEVVRTVVRREVVMSWDDPAKVVTEPGTASLVSYALDMTNGGCSGPTGFFEPPFGTAGEQRADAARRVDPYDRSEPVDRSGGTASRGDDCATATRS